MLAGDWCDWDPRRGAPWTAPVAGVWTARLDLPPDAYLEYALFRSTNDGDRVPDPLNRHSIPNGLGQVNHRLWMPAAPREVERRRHLRPRGKLTATTIATSWLATTPSRRVWVYRPTVPPGPLPLLVAWDGQDFRRRAPLPVIVDELVSSGRMAPVALALVGSTTGRRRMVEYAANDVTLGLLPELVLPMVRKQLALTDPSEGEGWGVLGASMGGLMALYTALRMPDTFRRVLALSGAFELGRHAAVTSPLVDHLPREAIRVWMRSGDYEWLAPAGDRMAKRLRTRGYDVNAGSFPAGHNYTAWGEVLPDGLAWLFPPP